MGEAITDNTPTADSTIASYTVSPNLPTGLSLNESTGVISGTPSTLSIQATYTVTATNESGSTTHDVFIAVVDRAPSLLSYTTNSPNYEVNAIITSNNPTNSGGTIIGYSVSPSHSLVYP